MSSPWQYLSHHGHDPRFANNASSRTIRIRGSGRCGKDCGGVGGGQGEYAWTLGRLGLGTVDLLRRTHRGRFARRSARIDRVDEDPRSINESQTLFSEVRPLFAPPSPDRDPLLNLGYQYRGYLNYELELQASEKEHFKRMDSRTRHQIRSGNRRGVTVSESHPTEGLDQFYEIVAISYRGAKVPLADRHFLSPPSAKFLLPSAACCLPTTWERRSRPPVFSRTKIVLSIGMRGQTRSWHFGMTSIIWEAIRRYSAEGYRVFDFAGAGWEGEPYGPGHFKSKFGGTLTNFGRYRRIYSPGNSNVPPWRMKVFEDGYHRDHRMLLLPFCFPFTDRVATSA